jgi:hypothetical protein
MMLLKDQSNCLSGLIKLMKMSDFSGIQWQNDCYRFSVFKLKVRAVEFSIVFSPLERSAILNGEFILHRSGRCQLGNQSPLIDSGS